MEGMAEIPLTMTELIDVALPQLVLQRDGPDREHLIDAAQIGHEIGIRIRRKPQPAVKARARR